RIDEALIIAAGHKTDLLRIWLLRQRQAVISRQLTHLWLAHVAEGKAGTTKLFLSQAKQKICLVLRGIGSATQQPAISIRIEVAASVMARSQQVSADLPRSNQQLIELQMVVA